MGSRRAIVRNRRVLSLAVVIVAVVVNADSAGGSERRAGLSFSAYAVQVQRILGANPPSRLARSIIVVVVVIVRCRGTVAFATGRIISRCHGRGGTATQSPPSCLRSEEQREKGACDRLLRVRGQSVPKGSQWPEPRRGRRERERKKERGGQRRRFLHAVRAPILSPMRFTLRTIVGRI